MTRGKEAGRGRSSGAGIKGGKNLSHGGSGLLGKETSLVTGQVSSQLTSMGGIEGVDEGIDSSTVSAVRDKAAGQRSGRSGDGIFGFELGSVGVESKVSVGGVMGIDEGVPVGVLFNFFIIEIPDLGDNGSGSGGGSDGGGSLSNWSRFADFSVEGSGILTGSSDMITFNDSEAIFAGDVFDRDHFAIITNVRILTNAVTLCVSFFFENGSIFGGKSGTMLTVTGIEPLFFEDFGIFGVNGLRQGQ